MPMLRFGITLAIRALNYRLRSPLIAENHNEFVAGLQTNLINNIIEAQSTYGEMKIILE